MQKVQERGEQFIRQWKVLKRLEQLHFGITAEDLSREIGYSKRTIYRDLNVLMEVGFPLEREKSGDNVKWRLLPAFKTPNIPFSLTELISLYFSRGLLTALKGTPFKTGIDSALDKINKTLPVKTMDFLYFTEQTIIPKIGAFSDYKNSIHIIEQLSHAARGKKKCYVTYLAYGRDKPDKHLYYPYAMTYYEGMLYCVGFSALRQAMRTFAVQRIQSVDVLDEVFEIPEDFEISEFLEESFGISHEGKLDEVVLRFSKEYAPWIMERQWHPTQQIKRLTKGEIELRMKIAGMADLLCWLLPMGDGVKVIKPKQLADDIVKTCYKTLKQYNTR